MNEKLKKIFIFRPFEVSRVRYRTPKKENPRPRSGHRVVCDGINIYSYGGYNPNLPESQIQQSNLTWSSEKPLFRELWSFNLATRKWKLLKIEGEMPQELASNAMCLIGKTIMIYGGTGTPFGQMCSDNLIVCRLHEKTIKISKLETNGIRPPGLYGPAVLYHDYYFYTVGGTTGYAYNCDIYRLDIRTLKWESVHMSTGSNDEPLGRYRHELAFDKKHIYILAGGTGDWAFDLIDIPLFNLEKKSWCNITTKLDSSLRPPSGPSERKCHSAVQIETECGIQVFVAGGTNDNTMFNDIWRLDLSTLSWTLMRRSIFPHVFFHSAAVTPDGCMYSFGGIELKDGAHTRTNSMYKMWLCIPKLSEICWEALLYYNPCIDMYSKTHLLNTGIPLKFVERLSHEKV